MVTEQKNSYFTELTRNLQHEGLTVGLEEDGLLPVELDGRRLCLALDTGGIRYWKDHHYMTEIDTHACLHDCGAGRNDVKDGDDRYSYRGAN